MLLHVRDNSFQQERGFSNVCEENVRFQTTENKLCQESNTNKGGGHTQRKCDISLTSTIKSMKERKKTACCLCRCHLFIRNIKINT